MKKKRRIAALLAVIAVTLSLAAAFTPAKAYDRAKVPDYAYVDPDFSVTGDHFEYRGSPYLFTDSEATFMITGVFYKDDPDTPVAYTALELDNVTVRIEHRFWITDEKLRSYYDQTPEIGDLFYAQNFMGSAMVEIDKYPVGDTYYCGNGKDMFGEEFVKVMRHELMTELYAYTPAPLPDGFVIPGDLTEDEEIGLTDVIALNQNILGVRQLGCYAKLAADVNGDGAVDASDSLQILQYTVHLVDSLG